MTTALDRLEQAGYVKRVWDQEDSRSLRVEMTERAMKDAGLMSGPLAKAGAAVLQHYTRRSSPRSSATSKTASDCSASTRSGSATRARRCELVSTLAIRRLFLHSLSSECVPVGGSAGRSTLYHSGNVGRVVCALPCRRWVGQGQRADGHGRADGLHGLQSDVRGAGCRLGAGDCERRPWRRLVARDAGVRRFPYARSDHRCSFRISAASAQNLAGRAATPTFRGRSSPARRFRRMSW